MFHFLSSATIVNTSFKLKFENQTLNCKISGDHQIQTLRSVGHLTPGCTSEPSPTWPTLAIYAHRKWPSAISDQCEKAIGHLSPTQHIAFTSYYIDGGHFYF